MARRENVRAAADTHRRHATPAALAWVVYANNLTVAAHGKACGPCKVCRSNAIRNNARGLGTVLPGWPASCRTGREVWA